MPFLPDIAIVTATAVVVSVLLARLRLPAVTGFIVAGALLGPGGAGLLGNPETLHEIAEAGVVLLLFTIGLEFSLERLRRIARFVFLAGGAQVVLTVMAVTLLAVAAGESAGRGLLAGFVVALSSTAVVLQVLAEGGEVDAPHGRVVVGVLIFQDLSVIPMALLVPVLGGGEGPWLATGVALSRAFAFLAAALLVSRVVMPRILALVDATRSREAFLLAVIAACAGMAWAGAAAGLSLSLGAFLAGIMLAGTEYGHRALGDVFPVRSIFTSLFFVSLGTLLDPSTLLERPLAALVLFLLLVPGKWAITTIVALVMRAPARVAVQAGAGLAQFGEFGFVLLGLGAAAGLVEPDESRLVLTVGVITMLLAPVLIRGAPAVAVGARVLDRLARGPGGGSPAVAPTPPLSGHVVIVGFGISGQVLAQALTEVGARFVVCELNAATVRAAQAEGRPVYYGDAASPETLARLGVEKASAIVVMINDRPALRRVVPAIRAAAGTAPLLVRTRYLEDRDWLVDLGATDVVAEEVEAGVEMLARVMSRLGLSPDAIESRVLAARAATAPGELRRTGRTGAPIAELAPLSSASFLVRADSWCRGRSLVEVALRSVTGASVVAVRRAGHVDDHVGAEEVFEEGDTMYLVGPTEALARAARYLERGEAG